MGRMVYEAINEFANGVNCKNRDDYQKKKRSKKGGVLWQSGMVGVVHTFGRNVGFNPIAAMCDVLLIPEFIDQFVGTLDPI